MTEPTMQASERVVAFLAALQESGDGVLCSPPGLGSVYQVGWIKRGLKSGALQVHHLGQGLALTCEAVNGDPRKLTLTAAARSWEYAQRMADEH